MTTHAATASTGRSRAPRYPRPEAELVAISCACGRTLVSATRRGLIAQVTTHWRLGHREPIVITPEEFVARHAFPAGDDY
jgi:hypothetical protein